MAIRNWRVPTRLNAILLLPVIVGLIFGGLQVQDSISTWNEAEDATHTAELVEAAATYGNALIDERDRTAAPLLAGDRDNPEVERVRAATDKAKADFDRAVDRMPDEDGLHRRLAAFRKQEPKLDDLRDAAYTDRLPGVKTEEGYVTIQHPLMEFANELGFGTGNVTSYGRTVYAISLAKAALSLDRALGTHLLLEPGPTAKDKKEQLTAFASYAYLENIALGEYTSGGLPEDVDLLKTELKKAEEAGKKKSAAAQQKARAKGVPFVAPPSVAKMTDAIGTGARPSTLKSQGVTAKTWFAASTGKFDAYRSIETELADKAVAETEAIADDARTDAIIMGVIVLLALLAAFILAGMMARSMSRNMRSLRTAAFDVAEQRLPELVDQLSRTDPGRIDTRVRPIPIDSRDEIGEVARAFDQVHREAVRLAAEQALLRGNVNAIFTNLSRRNQGLIERQLGYITDLENNEADPDQLENLFRLDHLATRMRRNGENLLVLAGEEPGRRWTQPVPLVDILRAASSEVEYYERVEISGVPESEIHGQVVNDLVHLLAELLENATSFSSPQTKVQVTATRLPDGRIMIEIHDKGIGLTAEDFADINHKLANPPVVDAAVSQRMGLFVVGRLADRHGIRVQLRPSGEQAGTTSLVMLPEAMTHGGGGEDVVEEDFHVSRIMQEQAPLQPAYEGQISAAELGFDDSRFEVPDDLSSLDPVSRSLAREERRAALEGGDPQQQPEGGPHGQQPDGSGHGQGGFGQGKDAFGPGGFGQGSGADAFGGPEWNVPRQGQEFQPAQDPFLRGQARQEPAQEQSAQPGLHLPRRDPELYREPLRDAPRAVAEDQQAEDDSPEALLPQGGAQSAPQHHDPSQQSFFEQTQDPQQALYERQYGTPGPEAESLPGVHDAGRDRVGFDTQGPSPSGFRSTTDAGLPRRDRARGAQAENPEAQQSGGPEPSPQPAQENPAEQTGAFGLGGGWRSSNDERWNRAGQLRDPQAGGVTSSGLPRRVPKANLVEGAAEQSPQGGPSVSRAPEDVRGRLSNLHRGVRRGRIAGDANQNDRQGFGPGSTYDQER
nr:nitrate- and nitrite sensing domain-containing protein [Streptomyces sp. HNM0574]